MTRIRAYLESLKQVFEG
uniref:Uncharacterized protein n=1 Tax=Anguilla anguilla TaxID=7936 RepID=A0A0E9T8B9_ANGAN